MDLRLIRNATLRLHYGEVDFLIDPMLGTKYAIRAMGDSTERNPTVELPCTIDEVLAGADAVIVSHLHPDHFDDTAFGVVPRGLPMFCQPGDAEGLAAAGFQPIELHQPIDYRGVTITPVAGEHGCGPILESIGSVIGLVFTAPAEPTLYWAGDTILCDAVRNTMEVHQPDVIITHSGGALVSGSTIIMDIDDTIDVARLAPAATIVAVHLEAVGHAPVTRAALATACLEADITPARIRIPRDGETITVPYLAR